MIREATTQICGRTYSVTTHPADEGLRLMFGIGKLLPAKVIHLLLLVSEDSPDTVTKLRDPEILAALLASVYRHATDDAHTAIRDAFRYCTVDPLPFGNCMGGSAFDHFGALYSGNYTELVDALIWVLTVNFGKPSDSTASQRPDGDGIPSSEGGTKGSTPRVSVRVSSG